MDTKFSKEFPNAIKTVYSHEYCNLKNEYRWLLLGVIHLTAY